MDGVSGSSQEHSPVLQAEVLELLQCAPGGVYVDATVGMGGHSLAIVERIQPGGFLIGIDRDSESLARARQRLAAYASSMLLVHDNYKNLPLILNNLGRTSIDGILVDLGVSSYQLLSPDRGFSFQADAPLDMRMDRTQQLTAADLVNDLPEDELADLIFEFGEERASRRIAAAIAAARSSNPIRSCSQLAEIVSRALRVRGFQHTHPATRTFQALRIAVNRELEGLEEFLRSAVPFLPPGARLAVIAFHSLEDRIVKRVFRSLAGQCTCDRPAGLCTCPREAVVRLATGRAVRPGDAEMASNPRSRSARLRGVIKLPANIGE
jgi:16S rRNA (cytosine1402-N4)-methyltransferase